MSSYDWSPLQSASGGGVPIYADFASFPPGTTQGDLAVDASTGDLYEWNGSSWVQIAGPGAAISLGSLDDEAADPRGASLTGGVLSMQSATATEPGLVNDTTQTFGGDKTIDGNIAADNLSGTNTGDVTLTAVGAVPNANGASLSGQALTLQPADGTNPGALTAAAQTIGGAKTFSSTISASNLSGTNTGDVTIGSANGLSIVGQALSLGLSSTSTTGALSDTDWDTFNNKQAAIAVSDTATIDLTLSTNTITADIVALSITNAYINASAAIAYSKLALTGSIVNADISASAAIDFSKLAALTSANILVGSAGNVATSVAMTGDISITNAGLTAYAGVVSKVKGGTGADNSSVTFPATGVIVTEAGSQVLTNKTLTTPVIASISNSGTITLPTGTRTLVARDTSDVLTSKDLTATSNTFTVAGAGQAGVVDTISQTWSGRKTLAGGLGLSRTNDTSTGTVNALAVPSSYIKFTASTTITLNGITAGSDGQVVFVHNTTGNNMTVVNLSGTPSANARIISGTGGNVTVANNGMIQFLYDSQASLWIHVSH